ncbi:conserved Plasmodium protein, unknown function [Plasmodium gallinaceum]|uniref:Uncharacterized protein n=1 Tax=Plasmodium gallinaceum TaxID=5849 RepID=A0A1J1GPK0_PLAGA|nr:conserved Plasmodium protein, unknown function [Plasmodium gallinaceum]CRG93215.1 conserved Plasmodium protein, unknown function [Plasmodium gallinaceum]
MDSLLNEQDKNNLLKGIGNKKIARSLLEIIMNKCDNAYFKITIEDKREFFGSLKYVDKYFLFLTDCEEHYIGNQIYVRKCGDILIPLKIIKLIEIKKSYFDNCYEELKKI